MKNRVSWKRRENGNATTLYGSWHCGVRVSYMYEGSCLLRENANGFFPKWLFPCGFSLWGEKQMAFSLNCFFPKKRLWENANGFFPKWLFPFGLSLNGLFPLRAKANGFSPKWPFPQKETMAFSLCVFPWIYMFNAAQRQHNAALRQLALQSESVIYVWRIIYFTKKKEWQRDTAVRQLASWSGRWIRWTCTLF